MRRPTGDDGWLLVGYAVWFCLIYGIWLIVSRLLRVRTHERLEPGEHQLLEHLSRVTVGHAWLCLVALGEGHSV